MPIYAFTCTACGHDYDRLQKLSDPDPAACPQCGANAVKRQLTAPSFRLSGSGWYETDFKKDGDKQRNLTEKREGGGNGDASKPELKEAAKSESKAATPPTESKGPPTVKNEVKTEAKPAAKPSAGV